MNSKLGTQFHIDIDKMVISNALHSAFDKAFHSEHIEINDYQIYLKRKGPLEFEMVQTKLLLQMPILIHLKKPEGLFSIEGRGSVDLKINVDFEINEDFHLSTTTSIESHEWLEKPNLKMGIISIPVTSLLNLVISRFDDKIVHILDEKLKEQVDLRQIILHNLNIVKHGIKVPSHPDLMVYIKPKIIHIQNIKDQDNFLKFRLLLVKDILLTDESSSVDIELLKLSWTAVGIEKLTQEIFVSLSYKSIGKMITSALDGMEAGGQNLAISHADIQNDSTDLIVSIHLTSPTKSTLTISGSPIFNSEEGVFDLEDPQVNLKAKNILYKLSSPIIEKLIAARVKDSLPIHVNRMIKEAIDAQIPTSIDVDLGQIRIEYQNIKIEGISFENDKLIGKACIEEPKLKLSLDDIQIS